jgi:hypothetical protein
MTIDLKPEFAERLCQDAAREGIPPEEYAARALEENYDAVRRKRMADLLDSFLEGDPDEQRETFEVLRKGLNAAHPDRPIFPPELEGVTWQPVRCSSTLALWASSRIRNHARMALSATAGCAGSQTAASV